MKILQVVGLSLILYFTFLCCVARAGTIKKELPCGSTTDVAKIYQPPLALDQDGDPTDLPAVSTALRDRFTDELYLCLPIEPGALVTSEYAIPEEWRYKAWAKSYSGPDCTGSVSDPSADWYLVFVCAKPEKPEVR